MSSSEAPTTGERQFPCEQCGANVLYAPGQHRLRCPYCGEETAVPELESEAVRELDFQEQLRELAREAPQEVHSEVRCDGCGAITERPPDLDAYDCPYCGRAIVATASSQRRIRPDSVLPFQVDRGRAEKVFRDWVASRWFAPNRLGKDARGDGRLKGIYQPYWTYDCHSHTRYTGQRGDAYWDTVRSTTMVNGKPTTTTRRVRRIRWRSAAGHVSCFHNDVLVAAAQSLPPKLQHALEPWDLRALVPYRDEFLAGFVTEGYRIDLESGFGHAQQRMSPTIRAAIQRDIGGDEQRIHSRDSSYADITFKHILLPVWVSAYRYGGKTYRFLINARTGEVAGERPYSTLKISLAVFAGLVALGLVLFFATRN